MEIFKDVKGFEGLYKVSNYGRVLSLPKGDGNGNRERFLKQDIVKRNHTNYRRVTFCQFGITKRYQVHRLVGLHFIPNPENKPQVNHIDNNGENNKVSNLEWATHSENMKHAQRQGRLFKIQQGGGRINGEKRFAEVKARLKEQLGDRLVGFELSKKVRRLVTFLCRECNKSHKTRIDSDLLKKNGICTMCSRTETKNQRITK